MAQKLFICYNPETGHICNGGIASESQLANQAHGGLKVLEIDGEKLPKAKTHHVEIDADGKAVVVAGGVESEAQMQGRVIRTRVTEYETAIETGRATDRHVLDFLLNLVAAGIIESNDDEKTEAARMRALRVFEPPPQNP